MLDRRRAAAPAWELCACPMEPLLTALKAAAEPTRLRLLALCTQGEWTVSDLTQILGQSQPRVSRHLKLLGDAGLVVRQREGTWVWYRVADDGAIAEVARALVALLPAGDPDLALDRERLSAIRRSRAAAASAYFRDNAARWDQLRGLHVPEREVEDALAALLPDRRIGDLLDIGTGTGRMLVRFGLRAARATGVDLSREMLAVARAKLAEAGLRHCHVRHGDMYQLPFHTASFDLALLYQVLHYAEAPAEVVREAARVLRPTGRLLVVDFAPHDRDELRTEHAHRRLGFADAEVVGWCRAAGLECSTVVHLPGTPLTVTIWPADRADAEHRPAVAAATDPAAEPAEPPGPDPGPDPAPTPAPSPAARVAADPTEAQPIRGVL